MSDFDPSQTDMLQSGSLSVSQTRLERDQTALHHPGTRWPANAIESYPERANLYRLDVQPLPERLFLVPAQPDQHREAVRFIPSATARELPSTVKLLKRALQCAILERIDGNGFKVSTMGDVRFPLILDMAVSHTLPRQPSGGTTAHRLSLYSAYDARVMYFADAAYYLCVNHHLINRTFTSLANIELAVASFQPEPGQRVFFRAGGTWVSGRLKALADATCCVALDGDTERQVDKHAVFLDLTHTQLAQLAPLFGTSSDELDRRVKQLSFLTAAEAPRARLDAGTDFVERLAAAYFPLHLANGASIHLDTAPAVLRPPYFIIGKDVEEVDVAFDHVDRSKRSRNILTGLTRFGAYDKPATALGVALVAPSSRMAAMERLVQRLNAGAQRYPGAQRVFGGALVIRERATADLEQYDDALRRLVREPSRQGVDLALVYLPKSGNISSPAHPYYQTKRLLTREGLVSQMVDEATVRNPNWRDLNLALNMFAKAGYAPWVLDEPIRHIDLFIGLSSSQVLHKGRIVRMMGYVNVFDSYGRWQFYQGDAAAFAFDERLRHYEELVKNSVASYHAQHGGVLRAIQIHLTKPFSAQERRVLAQAVRTVVGDCTVTFVWVNRHHAVRLYDVSAEGRGYIARTTYLQDGANRLYVATTGNNSFGQKGMGTPVPLQLTVWADPPDTLPPVNDVAQQIVSLTRLNWASSRNFCQEPITTKYAGDIARFMTAFVDDPTFAVNPSLRDRPWFL